MRSNSVDKTTIGWRLCTKMGADSYIITGLNATRLTGSLVKLEGPSQSFSGKLIVAVLIPNITVPRDTLIVNINVD